ncbi:hypothetical protein QA943_40910 [Streptomyces sp. B21-097]|uniref:hypothetical protein n=1 Tax=Streptomyces sp. B21-097 TaxID=3039414 RepID=UPI002FEF0A09
MGRAWPASAINPAGRAHRIANDQESADRARSTAASLLKAADANFYDMLARYDVADVYPVYSHLSSLSHTTISTASAYVEQMIDDSLQIRQEAADLGHADIIQLALALLQTATVMSPLIDGDPLRASIDEATTELGLEDTQLLPARVR